MAELTLEGLSVAQIEDLIEDQDTDEGKEALRALLDQRQKLDERLQKAPKRGKRSGSGRAPTDRHLAAVEHFNQDADKLARLKKALDEAVDENGEPILSVELIRIGIGAYYDQRKRDDEAKKAGVTTPVVPEPTEGDLAEAEAEAIADLPDTIAEPLDGSGVFEDDPDTDLTPYAGASASGWNDEDDESSQFDPE